MSRVPVEPWTDEKIVREILKGEPELFREIVTRHQGRIFAVGMRFCKNREDARDFVQEVFLRAYGNLDSFRGESRFASWLAKIAYNHGINTVKGRKEYESLVEEYAGEGRPGPDAALARKEISLALKKAIGELPDRYRLCLDLYFFFGLTHLEIRELTGFPLNTIKSHVFRAKQMLRDALRGTIAEEYHEL